MSVNINILKANNGDSILVSYIDDQGLTRNILFDGGIAESFGTPLKNGDLKLALERIKSQGQVIDLLIVTHIDDDHIGGIIRLYENQELAGLIKNIWFNSGDIISKHFQTDLNPKRAVKVILDGNVKTSVKQGQTLEKQIDKFTGWKKEVIKAGYTYNEIPACTIKVLSPNDKSLLKLNTKWETEKRDIRTSSPKKDYGKSLEELILEDNEDLDQAIPNGSSIAVLLEILDKKILMLADAHPNIIIEALSDLDYTPENKLPIDLVKLSHHGSKKNTSKDFLNLIKCDKYVISTDGSKHALPNKTTLARVVKYQADPATFYFNYDLAETIFSKEEIESGKFKAINLNNSPIIL